MIVWLPEALYDRLDEHPAIQRGVAKTDAISPERVKVDRYNGTVTITLDESDTIGQVLIEDRRFYPAKVPKTVGKRTAPPWKRRHYGPQK